MENKKPDEIAYIQTTVNDQWGGSNCSNCNYDITSYVRTTRFNMIIEHLKETLAVLNEGFTKKDLEEILKKHENDPRNFCPGCGKKLEDSGMYISPGGSDF